MKICVDCMPCFLRQAIQASRMTQAGPGLHLEVIRETLKSLARMPAGMTPPEMGRDIYHRVSEITGVKDPCKKIKIESNQKALAVYPRLREKVKRSRDRLRAALDLAIAGNIIDYGVKHTLDLDAELARILKNGISHRTSSRHFEYKCFRSFLRKSQTILFLADNAGETVFDRILLEEIKRQFPRKEIFYAVKSGPAINDALIEDARQCGIDHSAQIIESGSDAPGTVLRFCSRKFRRLFYGADMVISKGQGNFEALSRASRPVFFLFMVKCLPVAQHAGCDIGSVLLNRFETGKRKR